MFLHLGGNIDILNQEIIAILDYQSIRNNPDHQYIVDRCNSIHPTDQDKIKSVILTREEIYFSPISSLTLKKRADIYSLVKGEAYDQ
jgi:hypothetical protein